MFENFKRVRDGVWRNDVDRIQVSINEDYRRTFTAWYTITTPSGEWTHPFFNKSGNAIRFRSKEAAAMYAMKHKPTP